MDHKEIQEVLGGFLRNKENQEEWAPCICHDLLRVHATLYYPKSFNETRNP